MTTAGPKRSFEETFWASEEYHETFKRFKQWQKDLDTQLLTAPHHSLREAVERRRKLNPQLATRSRSYSSDSSDYQSEDEEDFESVSEESVKPEEEKEEARPSEVEEAIKADEKDERKIKEESEVDLAATIESDIPAISEKRRASTKADQLNRLEVPTFKAGVDDKEGSAGTKPVLYTRINGLLSPCV